LIVAQGILLALLLTGAHPFEPWSSSAQSSLSSSLASSASQQNHAAEKLLKRFGRTAALEIEQNPGDQAVCEGVVKGEVLLGGVVFGSADEAGASFLSLSLFRPALRRATMTAVLTLPELTTSLPLLPIPFCLRLRLRAARSFLAHLLSHDPSTRATASQALASRWIEGSKQELETLYERVVGAEGGSR
jgi:serine/threonine protein kinase